jgi:hypothetical protein
VTVYWNGRLVHDDVAIPHPTGSRRARGESASEGLGVQIGTLVLQDHASGRRARCGSGMSGSRRWSGRSYEPGPWADLFDPDRPEDWIVRGGAAGYELVGGELIGTTRPNIPNSFYTSARAYGDFELVYEAKTDPRLNSGVQIRSGLIGGEAALAGGAAGLPGGAGPLGPGVQRGGL